MITNITLSINIGYFIIPVFDTKMRAKIVIFEISAGRHFSHMSALFEARAKKERVLHLRECAEYVFSHRSSYKIF
jgi:hypothetical protein